MAVTDLYTDVDQVRKYVKGINASVQLDDLRSVYRQAREKIENIITLGEFSKIEAHKTTPEGSNVPTWDAALDNLQGAMANFMAIHFFIFEASERNNTSNNLYRYQEDKILETYLEIAWINLSDLIILLDTNPTVFTIYAASYVYTQRQKLYLKSSVEFAKYYGSVKSAYFYSNAVFLMEEIELQEIKKRLQVFPDNIPDDDDLKWNIGKAIAYLTLSRACIHFDYSELPKTLRNDIIRETNTKQKNEADVKQRLAAIFYNEAKPFLRYIELEADKLRNIAAGTELEFPGDINDIDDKHYLMT